MYSVNGVKGISSTPRDSLLGWADHVRQVSPDRHPATVRNGTKLKIGTWNVRTLAQPGKLDNIIQEMKRMNLNVLGLSEMRWKGAGCITSDNYTIIYSGGHLHQRGVGIILDQKTSKAMKGFWTINDRVIIVKLRSTPFDIGIIQVYAPTADKDDTAVEEFYENVDEAMKQMKSQEIRIVMGDFNSKVGKDRKANTVGPFGLGEINERGERLIEWCREQKMAVMNTWFKNHPRRCWTWKCPGDRTRNMIDYIMIQERFRNAVTSCKSMPGADCGSDHIPVIATMRVKLKIPKKAKKAAKLQLNILKNDQDIKEAYRIEVKNRFEALGQITEVEEMWEMLKDSINESAKKFIPVTKRKEHKKWMKPEILQLMEDRRNAKGDVQKYRELDRMVKKNCNIAKEEWINLQCEEIERNSHIDSKLMHKKIQELTGKTCSAKSGCIKSRNGDILMEKEDILNRWSEYIEELYHDDRGPPPHIHNEEGYAILEEEIHNAFRKMKNGKAAGPDDLPFELIAALDELGIKSVTKLVNNIYDTGTIPEDMKRSVYIALPKKPGTVDCDQHRTISLMSHLTKILLRVLMNRIRNKILPEVSETQFGFMKDKGTRNAIFALKTLMERSIEVQKDLYLCFIDYSKAFDKVRHSDLFDILTSLDIDGKDLRIIRNLYWEQEAAIRVDNDCSAYRPIRRGVRQGCVFSPDLFNIYSEMILRGIENLGGINVGGHIINNLRYADDTVLIADSEDKLQEILTTVAEESEKKGLQLNAKKTECMVVSKKNDIPKCNITCNGENIKQVDTFKYLGCTITPDGRSVHEIKKRIGISKATFNNMKCIFTNKNIHLATKIRTLKTYIWSILLYGCECWTLTKDTQHRLEAAEIWFIRRIMKVSWTEKKTNEEVMRMAGYSRSLLNTINERRLKFFGHIMRSDGLEKCLMLGKIPGKKSRGRQRTKYTDNLNKITANHNIRTTVDLIRKTECREDWRFVVADVCGRPGT